MQCGIEHVDFPESKIGFLLGIIYVPVGDPERSVDAGHCKAN